MQKERILLNHPQGMESKGTILLVHGTAAMNIDGNIPGVTAEQYTIAQMSLYKRLSDKFLEAGWSTLRYTRAGVLEDRINYEEYNKVDLPVIMEQLNTLLESLPSDKPRIILCWSGGSVHALQMNLEKAEGLIILGGFSTKRYHMALQNTENIDFYKQIISETKDVEAMTYEEALEVHRPNNPDGPFIKFWQEDQLKDNWCYLKNHPELPTLILQGTADPEVPIIQARLWKELLPLHNITTVEIEGGDHALNTSREKGPEVISREVTKWLENIIK